MSSIHNYRFIFNIMKTPQTPSPKLAAALGIPTEVWIKREDKHHYGSHKGRSIPLMIATHHKNGANRFVISSSGNAALAAIHAIQAHNKNKPTDLLELTIFIGKHIDTSKKALLERKINGDTLLHLEQVEAPKQAAIIFEKQTGAALLRQSIDDVALVGYAELAKELAKIEGLAAVFIPTSSGTTAQGLAMGFSQLGISPQIHIVQTAACHPIVEALKPETKAIQAESSLAGAIVDKIAHRKMAVIEAITKSNGSGWVANDDEITQAIALTKETADLIVSPNGALSIVGLEQANRAGTKWKGPVVCLVTGQ